MPTTVKVVEKRKKQQHKKIIVKSTNEDDFHNPEDDQAVEALAEETRRLAVDEQDEDMTNRRNNDIFANTEGLEDDIDDYNSSSSEIDESEINGITDPTALRLIGKVVREQKRFKEQTEDRTDRLFAVTRSLCSRTGELKSHGQPVGLIYPPKGWTAQDLRNWILPEWEAQRLGSQQGVLSLSSPFQVPLTFTLQDTSCFRGFKEYCESLHADIAPIQLNGSSIQQQTRQINSLRACLLKEQKPIVAAGTKGWFFRLAYPQQRHVVNGEPDDADDWSIEILWHPEKELYRTLVQCCYRHIAMEQVYKIDEKVVADMGEGWNCKVIRRAIDNTVKMYRMEVSIFDTQDPPLEPLGKYRNRGGPKGSGKVNHQYVNRANSKAEDVTPPAKGTGILADVGIPPSMTNSPPAPRYAMAIGTGKGSESKDGGYYSGKSSGKSSGYNGSGKATGKYGGGGKSQSKFGSGGKFGGKPGGLDLMQQFAAFISGCGAKGNGWSNY